jgi:hypothetical protein
MGMVAWVLVTDECFAENSPKCQPVFSEIPKKMARLKKIATA